MKKKIVLTLLLMCAALCVCGRKVYANIPLGTPIDAEDCEIILDSKTFVYDGKDHKPAVTVKYKDEVLEEGQDYMKDYCDTEEMDHTDECVNAGQYYVYISINEKNHPRKSNDGCMNETNTGFTIKPAKNSTTVKGKTFKLSRKTLRKKKKVIKKPVTVSKKKGTITYKITKINKKSKAKYFSINKKSGTLTVKKGLGKGTYKVTVQVTSGRNYDPQYKKAVVTIKVK